MIFATIQLDTRKVLVGIKKLHSIKVVQKFKCSKCSKGFDRKDNASRHEKACLAKKKPNNSCSIYPKEFAKSWMLKWHMVTHVEKKTFKCDVCYTVMPTADAQAHSEICNSSTSLYNLKEGFASMVEIDRSALKLRDETRLRGRYDETLSLFNDVYQWIPSNPGRDIRIESPAPSSTYIEFSIESPGLSSTATMVTPEKTSSAKSPVQEEISTLHTPIQKKRFTIEVS